MNKIEEMLQILNDAHDVVVGEHGDSDLSDFETDEEELECAPLQYAARKIWQVVQMLQEQEKKE